MDEEMTVEAARKGWGELIESMKWRPRGVRIRKYKTPVAAMVPIDWYERAVAAIGKPGDEPPATA
ncbi:hypothetical protein [Streptomyces sp. NPDC058157]|uniref:hypothetical protein n=1 Tax=Streptomyces sp. NPDC058157 TaxID=3346360 RepID=UPI0036E7F5BE